MMTEEKLIEVMARAISGAPFPSTKSLAKARAALAAVREAGYTVVPVEPTPSQTEAGIRCPQIQAIDDVLSFHQARGYKIDALGNSWDTCALAEAYRAMIAAA